VQVCIDTQTISDVVMRTKMRKLIHIPYIHYIIPIKRSSFSFVLTLTNLEQPVKAKESVVKLGGGTTGDLRSPTSDLRSPPLTTDPHLWF